MPRLSRLDTPGLLHHVMIRGIERRNIFRDDEDRNHFLERMTILVPETKTLCYAWALMPNHAHLLLRSGPSGISLLMRRLLTGYAGYFNRRHRRHGQLFQNRFKSIICQEDAYLQELVRYIHLNPLRGKIVQDMKSLDGYRYSGHAVLMGKVEMKWQDVDYVLGYFSKSLSTGRKKYRAYVEHGIAFGRRPELVGGGLIRSLGGWKEARKLRLKGQDRIKGDQRILGEGDFVSGVLSDSREVFNKKYELKSLGVDFNSVLKKVSSLFGLEKDYILERGRQADRVRARDLVCYWSVKELGIPMAQLAKQFGSTPVAVGYAVKRGDKLAKEGGYVLGAN
ncbi:MAG: transposase [Desulfobacteraceae bacterium]|nr:transposase [Desulfobacteraceae bacterium]MBU4037624.1 transposase [Pseudomonadota bacterium]